MPSQLPGSSLMMPTLVFQVVQFTSSTLQGEEMGQQGAGGPQPRGPSAPSDQGRDTAGKRRARRGLPSVFAFAKDIHAMSMSDSSQASGAAHQAPPSMGFSR